jgi:hypothetical protein
MVREAIHDTVVVSGLRMNRVSGTPATVATGCRGVGRAANSPQFLTIIVLSEPVVIEPVGGSGMHCAAAGRVMASAPKRLQPTARATA